MRSFLLCALAALTTITTVAAAEEPITLPNPPDLPDIGSPASAVLSGSDEYQLGAMVIQQIRDQNGILEDPEVTEYLNALGSRLATQAPDGAPHFQFFAVKDTAINAFAMTEGNTPTEWAVFRVTEVKTPTPAANAPEEPASIRYYRSLLLASQAR